MQTRNSNSGSIDLLIVATIAVLTVTAVIILLSRPQKAIYSFNVHNSMTVIKQNLYLHMDDATGWAATVADTTNTDTIVSTCLRGHADCIGQNGQIGYFNTINDVSGSVHLEKLNEATRGIGLDGKGCDGYDPVNGNPRCPIKVVISAKIDCGPLNPCVDPPYLVEVHFSYALPSNQGPKIDMSKYDFSLSKP